MRISKAEVEATGKPRLMGWDQVPKGHKTKTQWGKEGMKLEEDAEPAAYVYIKGRNEHYELNREDAVEPKLKQRPVQALPPTPENIGAALYEVNKAAKRRRNAARNAYEDRRYAMATSRRAENHLRSAVKWTMFERRDGFRALRQTLSVSECHDRTFSPGLPPWPTINRAERLRVK